MTTGKGAANPKARLIIVSEIFYPETTSTGYYLTAVAEKLVQEFDVQVLCSRPAGADGCGREIFRAIHIARLGRMTVPGATLVRRTVEASGRALRMLLWLLWHAGRKDTILVVTNPPFLPPVVVLAGLLKRSRSILLVHDVYPDAAVVAGLLRPGSVWQRLGSWVQRQVYRRVTRIICLGRDMRDLIGRAAPTEAAKLMVIPHWAEIDTIGVLNKQASRFGRDSAVGEKFVVLHAGNLGRTHDGDILLRTAAIGNGQDDVLFLMAVAGAQARSLAADAEKLQLGNFLVRPLPADRNCQSDTLAAADVVVIAFKAGMAGISVPSRMYNAMAAGRPLIGVTEEDSELALVIQEEGIGWVTPPGDPAALWRAICEARAQPDRLRQMGQKAREVALSKYSPAHALEQYRDLVNLVAQ